MQMRGSHERVLMQMRGSHERVLMQMRGSHGSLLIFLLLLVQSGQALHITFHDVHVNNTYGEVQLH